MNLDEAKQKAREYVESLLVAEGFTPQEVVQMAFELGMQLGVVAGKRIATVTMLEGLATIERDQLQLRKRFAGSIESFDQTILNVAEHGHL